LPSRRRCAPMSIKGTGSGGMCWFMALFENLEA
jgi:hypothetical protein